MKVDYWTERDKWPYAPPSHLFFPEFFEQVGQAIFPDEWSGHETRDPPVQPELPSPTKVFEGDTDMVADLPLYRRYHLRARELLGHSMERPVNNTLTQNEWAAARDRWYEIDLRAPTNRKRRTAVRHLIHDGAAAGTILLQTRMPKGGKFVDPGNGIWNCGRDVADARLISCALTHNISDAMLSPPLSRPARNAYYRGFTLPLFITRKNAEWALPILSAWHQGEIRELPVYQASSSAGAVSEISELSRAIKKAPPPPRASQAALEAFAAELDNAGISVRDVRMKMVKELWDKTNGAVPGKKEIVGLMKGQPKGRQKGS